MASDTSAPPDTAAAATAARQLGVVVTPHGAGGWTSTPNYYICFVRLVRSGSRPPGPGPGRSDEECSLAYRGNIGARLTRYGDLARLGRVPVLAATAALADELPAVALYQSDDLTDLHRPRIPHL